MLHLVKIRLTLQVELSEGVLRRYLPASPMVVGMELADQVDAYSRREKLGYYPALDYFDTVKEVVDPELLDAARNIAWFAGNAVREEIQIRLRGVFSNVQLESAQCLAFTFPPVRPNQNGALEDLADHYTPNIFRLCLLVSSLTKKEELQENMEEAASKTTLSHLRRYFDSVSVTSAQQV